MAKRDLDDRLFWLANEREIKDAKTTDIYFLNTKEVLTKHHIDSEVVMEVYARDLPENSTWGVLSGVYEVAKLLEGLPLDVWAFDEGSIFLADGRGALYEPVMTISGRYRDFVEYENPVLGLLSSFDERLHQGIEVQGRRGGQAGRQLRDEAGPPCPGAPHREGLLHGGLRRGLQRARREAAGGRALRDDAARPRAGDWRPGEGVEALRRDDAERASSGRPSSTPSGTRRPRRSRLSRRSGRRLWGVRLDTPASRRGNFRQIIEEVRWELKIRGGGAVKIFVSGRLSEEDVVQLKDIVDGFGVGTAVAYPPSIDFSAKIVEVREKGKTYLRAKRGGLGGQEGRVQVEGVQGHRRLPRLGPAEGVEADAQADNRQGQAGGRLPEHRLDPRAGSSESCAKSHGPSLP